MRCQCGAETTRLRSILRDGEFQDECPNCAPQSFEKQSDPSDKKIWMGWEAEPERYKKVEDGYQARDGVLSDLEEWALRDDPEDLAKYQAAVEWKRKNRRTKPMTKLEEEQSDNLVRQWEAEARLKEMGVFLPEGA